MCATLVHSSISALSPVTILYPQDTIFKPRKSDDQKIHFSQHVTYGLSGTHARNGEGDQVDSMQLWDLDQNALAMVTGFAQGTQQANIAQACNAVDGDDGVRGHFKLKGDFTLPFSYQAGARYYFKRGFWVGAFVPVYKMELKNVVWSDQTQALTADDTATKALITNDLFANVDRLGNGLYLKDWSKTGCGDITLMAGWSENYRQYKQWIKSVTPALRMGVSLPTGVKKDEDKVMSMSFGNDGSVGLLVGGGLTINYINRFDFGLDLECMHVFNNTRARRIKVDADQTEFLLLTKTDVQRDPGFFSRFMIFGDAKIVKGLSARVAYHHRKRGNDTLYVKSHEYSSAIANTAQSLKEWTTHNALVQLLWDTATEETSKNRPQFTAFYIHPFNGRRSVQAKQVGIGFTLSF